MNNQLRKKIKELEKYLTSPKAAPSNEIVDTYNQVFGPDPKTGRLASYTSCGSCLRRMVVMMSNCLKTEERNKKRKQEKKKKEDTNTDANTSK